MVALGGGTGILACRFLLVWSSDSPGRDTSGGTGSDWLFIPGGL